MFSLSQGYIQFNRQSQYSIVALLKRGFCKGLAYCATGLDGRPGLAGSILAGRASTQPGSADFTYHSHISRSSEGTAGSFDPLFFSLYLYAVNRERIRQRIHQGGPFSFISQFDFWKQTNHWRPIHNIMPHLKLSTNHRVEVGEGNMMIPA